MKTLFIAICIIIGSFAASSQKLNNTQVPVPTHTALAKKHPNVKATWSKENENYEAAFKEGGKNMSCIIDSKGTIIETETLITLKQLPTNVRKYVEDHYKGASYKPARIVKANGEVVYEVELKGMDVLFDADGRFIKEAKD